MKGSEILAHVDHTLLRPTASWEEIKTLLQEAKSCHTASVCLPAAYVAPAYQACGGDVPIGTVVGFPLGYDTAETKISAARQAINHGAAEVDAVVNLTDVKNGAFDKVTAEIAALKEAVGAHILKIIIETCYLTEKEKIALCRCVTDGGADFIKTSTGFGPAGAAHEDIALFRRHIGPKVRIKAAGGIRTIADMKRYLKEGCQRLGCSAAVGLLQGRETEDF